MSARVALCSTCHTWFGAFHRDEHDDWVMKQHIPPGKPTTMANLCPGSGKVLPESELRLPRNAGEVCLACGNVWPTPCDRDCPSLTDPS